MNKYEFYNDSIVSLAITSFIYSQVINANKTFSFIQNIISNNYYSQSFLDWVFGVVAVFIMSWITLLVNLHLFPRILRGKERKVWIGTIIGNIYLYIILGLLFYLSLSSPIYDASKVIPDLFGWSVVFMISILISNAIKYQRKSKLEAKEKEILLTEKLKSELNEIKTVINPHFLFNSLNTLNALITINPDKASIFTTHLSRLYRYILSNKDKDLISIEDELFFINDYVQLLKIRYRDSFNIKINISEKHKSYLIPPLSIQLLVENAEKHNVFTENQPLTISIFSEDDKIVVSHYLIERTENENSTGNGLSSLAKRCDILLKREIEIIKNDSFTVKVPIRPSNI